MESSIKKYGFLVIGAGSGGIASARRAAMYGQKVAVFENRVIGGTCVNVGCVPKKVMFNLANFLEDAQVMKDYCVKGVEGLNLDFKSFKLQRDAYIKRLNGIYDSNLKKAEIDYVFGMANFVSDKVVQVEGQQYTADHILIASGSAPVMPQFEGVEHCIHSDHIFDMEELPQSMIVVGGGYIGVEIGQIMNAFGVKVTQVVRSRMLRQVDEDVVNVLIDNMKKHGLDIKLGVNIEKVEKLDEKRLKVYLTDGTTLESEKVLLSLGRDPNVLDLSLDKTNIKLDGTAVWVDEFQNTSVPGVYAVGDCINNIQLTPVAIRAGRTLVERIFNNRTDFKMNYENVPTVIFSHPPIGVIGYTQSDAEKKFGQENVKTYKSQFVNMFYSLMKDNSMKQTSLFKIMTRKDKDGKEIVIGAHGTGRGIDEMMQAIAICIVMGATKDDFDRAVAIHPTASEEWVLMDQKIL